MTANKNEFHKGRVLSLYIPPEQACSVKLSDGRIWSSSKANVLFFETSSYGNFTDGQWLIKLLECLTASTSIRWVGLRIDPIKTDYFPEWLRDVKYSNGILSGFFGVEDIKNAIKFFAAIASYGLWDFYGINNPQKCSTGFVPLPDVLTDCDQYDFIVEIDLDSMLLGFVRPPKDVKDLESVLSQI